MKKVLLSLTVFALSICTLPNNLYMSISPASAKIVKVEAKSMARINIIIGKVQIFKNKKWAKAERNSILNLNDKVKTDKSSRLELAFSDGSRLRVDQNTEILLVSNNKDKSFFKIFTGRIWANVVNKKKQNFSVQSPTAVLSVMGTTFDVDVEKEQTEASVYDGSIGVQTPAKTEEELNKSLQNLDLKFDEHNDEVLKKPTEEDKPYHEVEKPAKLIPGPYQVSKDKWLEIVEDQKISVDVDGNAIVSDISDAEKNEEWVNWNTQLDEHKVN